MKQLRAACGFRRKINCYYSFAASSSSCNLFLYLHRYIYIWVNITIIYHSAIEKNIFGSEICGPPFFLSKSKFSIKAWEELEQVCKHTIRLMICKNCLQTFNVRLTDPFTPRLTLSRVIWPDSEGGEGEEKGWMCVGGWGMGNGGRVHQQTQYIGCRRCYLFFSKPSKDWCCYVSFFLRWLRHWINQGKAGRNWSIMYVGNASWKT